jgi:hypothetical protein
VQLDAASVRSRVCDVAFGAKLITNYLRGMVAEAIVAGVLDTEWRCTSADWAGWDFERSDGLRLEVKQSAARQTWTPLCGQPSTSRFDIKPRKGRYEGAEWFAEGGRHAHIYVFAHHFVADETADHCDPEQWRFFVVSTDRLPVSRSIGLRELTKLAAPCAANELAAHVTRAATSIAAI